MLKSLSEEAFEEEGCIGGGVAPGGGGLLSTTDKYQKTIDFSKLARRGKEHVRG